MISVSIVAMGQSAFNFWQDLTDKFVKPTDEVWAINNAAVWINPDYVDLGIAMDDPGRDYATHPEYVKTLGNTPFAMLTTQSFRTEGDELANSGDRVWPAFIRYPVEDVIESLNLFGPAARCLTNSACFAMALALHRNFDKIVLYGVDFCAGEAAHLYGYPVVGQVSDTHWPEWAIYHGKEALKRRAPGEPGTDGMMFLLGIAHQRGVEVQITHGSTLFDTDRDFYLYGYQDQPPVSDAINDKIVGDVLRKYRPKLAREFLERATAYLAERQKQKMAEGLRVDHDFIVNGPLLDTAENIDGFVRNGSGVGDIDYDPDDDHDPNAGLPDG